MIPVPREVRRLANEVEQFDGKVVEDMVRMLHTARDEDDGDSVNRTGAHAMILWLPCGRDLQVLAGDAANSALADPWGKMSESERK